jgi:allophanate hydrolase
MKLPVWISAIPERVPKTGPLSGLTFAIKDNIDYERSPTTAACPEFAYTPSKSASVVERLEDAGAEAIGKTNMDQFATGLVGVRSPYGACSSVFNAEYISGGSSSGSAVAVAAGEVDFSLGTDTAGSGRVPAAFNGIIGLKPSRNVISNRGVVPACRTLDCVSIFARDVATAGRVLNVAAEHPLPPPAPWTAGAFRFGVVEFVGDPSFAPFYAAAAAKFQAVGGTKVAIDYTAFRDAAQLLYQGPWVGRTICRRRRVDPTYASSSGRDHFRSHEVFRSGCVPGNVPVGRAERENVARLAGNRFPASADCGLDLQDC